MIPFERHRKATSAFALALLIGLTARANDPANIAPADLKRAEATYKDAFGAAHDKATKAVKPADKSEYAKKLLDASLKAANDPALQEVLRKYALQFAQADAVGTAVVTEIHKAFLAFPSRRAASMDKLGGLLEKTLANEPPATKLKVVAEVIKWYRDAAAEYERQGATAQALAEVNKARAVARKYNPNAKDVLAAIDADEKRVQSKGAEQAEFEKLRSAVEKTPGDLKARLALGMAYLRVNRLAEAGEQLREAGPPWKAFADLIGTKMATPGAVMVAAYDLAVALPAEERKLRLAMFKYAAEQGELARYDPYVNWPVLRPKYLDTLERLGAIEPGRAANFAPILVDEYLEQADEALQAQRTGMAAGAVLRARTAVKAAKPGDAKALLADIEQWDKAIKAHVAVEQEADKWKELAAKGPLDAKASLTYGIVLLRLDRPTDAAIHLDKSDNKAARHLAALLANKGKVPPLDLGKAFRAFGSELKGDEKNAVLALARPHYEAYLASNPAAGVEKVLVELLVTELPTSTVPRPSHAGNVITLIDENPKLADDLKADGQNNIFWDPTGALNGKGCLLLKQNLNSSKIPNWSVPMIVSTPDKNYHYLRFAWKAGKQTDSISLSFFFKEGGSFTYSMGPPVDGAVSVSDTISERWSVVTRDVQVDFPKASGTMIGSYFPIQGKDPTVWLDSLQFATSPRAFPPLRAVRK